MKKEKIQKAIDIVNENKDNPIIKEYCEALHIIVSASDDYRLHENKGNYYKSSDKYDYYIVEPYEVLDIKNGNYYFRQTGYDSYAEERDMKTGRTTNKKLFLCRSYCNYSLEKIKKVIDEHIIIDNKGDYNE